jgi:valyl-tRNA synthetase
MKRLKPIIREKRWDLGREKSLIPIWQKAGVYKFTRNTSKPIFSIDTPPPYASGKWHVGGATHYAQIDMTARYFRMRGYEVLFPFGVDRNGLPVEVEVEKLHNISAHEVPRNKFIELCRQFLDEVEHEIIDVARRMGMSCDLTPSYRTDSPEYRCVTQATFIELWKKGLVYEDDRPTNWCPVCRTTIADAEIEYFEIETDLYYIRFKLENGEDVVIATTRPELLCSCAAVIFNPSDTRYISLNGCYAIVPIYNKRVPITPNSYAKPEFGTGLVMICSFGDYSDIRLFRELQLKPVIAIDVNGRMNENAGPYQGLTVAEARQRIVEDLKASGIVVKVERIAHRLPMCWRSKNPIEFISMPEYYLKQVDLLDDLRKTINLIEFHPPESRQLLLNWVNSITADWPISRRRYYGTEIPVWYCKQCKKSYLPKKGRYYQPWREKAPIKKCACGSTEFVGETRTFDTWMDSSNSQLYVIGYLRDAGLFKRAFPCSLRPQGADIVRTWLYYSILKTYQLMGTQAFRHARISGMGLDEKGEAMHKSKGNVVYPEPLFNKFGADSFRLWGALEARLGSDYRYSESRLDGASKFITKLWNIARFISSFPHPVKSFALANLDQMILAKLNELIEECKEGYDQMDFFVPATAIRNFTWNIFADHFIEAVKSRAYNPDETVDEKLQRGAWYTLHTCLQVILKLLAPICPFITDAIWMELYGKRSIHLQPFPEQEGLWESALAKLTPEFIKFNTIIWKYKKAKGIALNERLGTVYAPRELRPLKDDLQAMHRIEELRFGKAKGKVESIGENVYLCK